MKLTYAKTKCCLFGRKLLMVKVCTASQLLLANLLADLGKDEVMAALQPDWTRKTNMTSRARQRMRAVFDYLHSRCW